MRRSYFRLLEGLLFSLPLLFASCGNGDNALEEIIKNGGGSGGSSEGSGGGSTPAAPTLDLSTLTAATTIEDGYTVTGTLAANVQISIAAGATVTLDGVTIDGRDINSTKSNSYPWAGITCLGDATIILKEGSTNTVKGFHQEYPGILAAHNTSGTEYTLTIKGTGSLTAESGRGNDGERAAGIGGASKQACGNIEIQDGTITATGGYTGGAGIGSGYYNGSCGTITISGGTIVANGGDGNGGGAGIGSGNTGGKCGDITITSGNITATGGGPSGGAGIGSGYNGICDNISISGGTIVATGKGGGAGIGSGKGYTLGNSSCGTITITADVTSVTATKGSDATNSIGAGDNGACGTVTIGGKEYWDGSTYQNGGGTKLPTSPYIYPTPVPSTAINGKFTINASGDQVYFAKGNLQAVCASADGNAGTQETFTWQFAANQYDFIGNAGGNILIDGNGSVSAAGTVDLFGWSTAATTYGIHNSPIASDYSGAFVDWGGNIGTGWRTLTKDEWDYLFFTRASGSKVNSLATTNARYTHATINTDDVNGGIKGMILFPDGVTINYNDVSSWGGINQYSNWYGSTKCTTSQWNALAAKGFVFLPAAGSRNGITIGGANDRGYYWSSYTASSNNAHYTRVVSAVEPTTNYDSRYIGFSVRLVYPID